MVIHDRYIRATQLIGFQELVEEFGGDALALLADAQIEAKALSEPDSLISYNAFGNLLEIASHQLLRPSLALEWTLRTPPHFPNLGPLALLAKFVGSVQEWIDTSLRYWTYHTDAFTLVQRIDETTGLVALRYKMDTFAFPTRQLTETVLGNTICLARNVTGHATLNPSLIRFQHGRPADLSNHERVFRCPIEFGAEHNEIVFDPSILRLTTNGNLKLFKPIVGYYMRHRIQRMPVYDQSMSTTIALAIPSIIGTGKCNIEFISESLGLTPKKLQRLLATEGTSFSAILENVRGNMARQYLSESNAPVARIAGLLDYSTTAPFSLAFKRWTGQTPLEFRKNGRLLNDEKVYLV
jgi:AraC-like DNA-binding protein